MSEPEIKMSRQRRIEVFVLGGGAIALLSILMGLWLRQLTSQAESLAYLTGAGAIGGLIEYLITSN